MQKGDIDLTELNAQIEKLIIKMNVGDKVSLIGIKEKTFNGVFEILVTLLIIHYDVAFPYARNETIPDIIKHLEKQIIDLLSKKS